MDDDEDYKDYMRDAIEDRNIREGRNMDRPNIDRAKAHALSAISLAESSGTTSDRIDNLELAVSDYGRAIECLKSELESLYNLDTETR